MLEISRWIVILPAILGCASAIGGATTDDAAASSTSDGRADASDGDGTDSLTGGAPHPQDAAATSPDERAELPTIDAHDDDGGDARRDADATGEGPPPPCTTAGTELCEDFESGAIDARLWTKHVSGGAALAVDGMHVHGGAFALHVKLVAGNQQTAELADAVTFPAASNTFYTRAWVYFDPDLPADDMGGFHMAYLLATGNNDLGFVEAGLGSAGQKQWLGYSEYYGDGPDVHAHGPTFTEFGPRSNVMVTPRTWTCLELMQGGDATTTHRRVWVDDVELPEQKSDFSDRKPPAFSLVSIGVLQYHPTPTLADVWFDDVRVSRARIGCGPTTSAR